MAHQCQTCEKSFATRYNYNRHLKKKIPCTPNNIYHHEFKKMSFLDNDGYSDNNEPNTTNDIFIDNKIRDAKTVSNSHSCTNNNKFNNDTYTFILFNMSSCKMKDVNKTLKEENCTSP
jgi:hypothetical protein